MMRIWARRYHDLGRLRTQAVCRLHAVLCRAGSRRARKHVRTSQAIEFLDRIVADSPIAQAKLALARDLIADLQRIDVQRRDAKRRTAQAVAASGTSITGIHGVGPIVTGTVLGYVRDGAAFPPATDSPPTTAAPLSRSPPATGSSTGSPAAATGNSTTPSTWPR